MLAKTPHRFILSCFKCQNVPLSNFLTGVNTDTPILSRNYVKDKKLTLKTTFKTALIDVLATWGQCKNL